jgi:peroxiredoxin
MRTTILTISAGFLVLAAMGQSGDGQMRLNVADAQSGQPLAGVKVRAWAGSGLVTDESGACSFALPQPGSGRFFYRIALSRTGYVPRYITWSQAQNDKIQDIPPQYTARMEPGVTIGAVVKNDKGEPIPGARVVFSGPPPPPDAPRERNALAPNYFSVRTGEDGRWQCSEAPKDFRGLTFRVTHPDYVPAEYACVGGDSTNTAVIQWPESDYLSGAAVMLLTHGIEVSGVVLAPSGKPAEGVTITRNHEWRNPAAILTTGEDGRFKIVNLLAGEMNLTFEASGLAGQTRHLDLSNGMAELKIEMKPGNHFQGRIVDQGGKPIAGAMVEMDRLDLGPLEYDWKAVADDQGRFQWDSAPEGPHPYYFSADGYRPRGEPDLVADGQDKIVSLRRAADGNKTIVDGHVTEAGSKAPITNFSLYVKEFNDDGVEHSRTAVSTTDGSYSVAVDPASGGCMIEIAAPGHAPQMSSRKAPRDGDQRLDFALEKGEGISGTILLPDGTPAAGAEVAVCSDDEAAILGQLHFNDHFQTSIVKADDNGEFNIPQLEAATGLFAVHEAGFGETNVTGVKGPFQITLAKWGAIQGIATAGGKLLQGDELVLIRESGASGLTLGRDAYGLKTDVDGGFVFSNVPPGNVSLFRVVSNKFIASKFLDVNAGQTTGGSYSEVDLGAVEAPPQTGLKVGDIAPAFETKTLNGQPLRLADYRGKYVLLDFWATWCGPCIGEIPHLKSAYDAFGSSDRFVMISLSLDNAASAPAEYARKNNIKWIQGFAGAFSQSRVAMSYGVEAIPAIFLIDPEGKIVALDLRGDAIGAAVEKALGNR